MHRSCLGAGKDPLGRAFHGATMPQYPLSIACSARPPDRPSYPTPSQVIEECRLVCRKPGHLCIAMWPFALEAQGSAPLQAPFEPCSKSGIG